MFLLILAQIVLVLASWLITAAMPEVFPRSLLSPEGIRWFFGTFTANLQSPWLVWLLLISIAWGTLRASGLLNYDHKVYRQRNALRLVCLEFVLFIGVMLLLTLIPQCHPAQCNGRICLQQFFQKHLALYLFYGHCHGTVFRRCQPKTEQH